MFNKAFNLLAIRPSAFQEILFLVQTAKQGIVSILYVLMTGILVWMKAWKSLQLPHCLLNKRNKVVGTTMQESFYENNTVETP